MRQLREFELWLEVEKPLAKGRMLNAPGQTSRPAQNAQGGKQGSSRDLAAERVGLGSGDKAEAAKTKSEGGAGPCGEIPHLEKTGNSRDLAALQRPADVPGADALQLQVQRLQRLALRPPVPLQLSYQRIGQNVQHLPCTS